MTPAPQVANATAGGAISLDDKYRAREGRVLLSGIEAIVRLVLDQRRLDAGRGYNTAAYVSGYEGSPLAGLDLELGRAGRHLEAAEVVFQPGLNEELAATAVAGTQLLGQMPGRRYDGVTAFWYAKNPGLDRAADAIRHGVRSGTAPLGGVVALVGDDPACRSSTIPSSCGPMAASLGMPLLAPAGVEDIVHLGLQAVALSRASGVWTSLEIVSDLADGAATVDLVDPAAVTLPPDPQRPHRPTILLGTAAVDAEEDLVTTRLPLVSAKARAWGINRSTHGPPDAHRVVVAGGLAYGAVVRALDDLGLGAEELGELGLRIVQLRLLWPLDAAEVGALVGRAREVLVVEEKGPFVEASVKAALYGRSERPLILGSTGRGGQRLLPGHGEVRAEAAAQALVELLGDDLPMACKERLSHQRHRPRLALAGEAPPHRTPYFCSGCPHNTSTRADPDQLVGVGIGCHTMVLFDEERRGHHVGSTQMGGEGAQWNGLAPFTDDPHYAQNLGDGTFFHSGSLAVRAAVAAGAHITYKLLFNGAVAMTGGQDAVGGMDVPTLARWLVLEGVTKVVVTTADPAGYRGKDLGPAAQVRHREELMAVQRELATVPGVTVIIHDDECAAEQRRRRNRGIEPSPPRRLFINRRVCEGCGDCAARSTCLSVVPVDTEYGRKTTIHQSSCNQDYSCLGGDCPSFVEVLTEPGAPTRPPRRARVEDPPFDLPEPAARSGSEVLVHMPGIGGTGVVTVSRLIQMAAHIDGLYAASVDQTGLAQKGGPVVSDVRISERPVTGSVRATARQVDVLLGMDLLGAAEDATLELLDPERSVAVVSTSRVPTAAMVTDPRSSWPELALLAGRIDARTRRAENRYLDAQWLSERLSGDHLSANVVLLGAAYQLGLLPVRAEALEQAIALNKVAAGANTAAFRWGRAAVVDPGALATALDTAPEVSQPGERLHRERAERALVEMGGHELDKNLTEMLAGRAADLIGYQNEAYARRYLAQVLAVASSERLRIRRSELPVTTAFARGLHKLMAYKDEYEVARLHLDPAERARLDAELGPHRRARAQLQPPLLRAMGLRRKVSLGRFEQPAFLALRAGRRLRGTALDPFGRTAVRRTERSLIEEYGQAVRRAVDQLEPSNAAAVTALAELATEVRGYEAIKMASVERFRRALAAGLLDLGCPPQA